MKTYKEIIRETGISPGAQHSLASRNLDKKAKILKKKIKTTKLTKTLKKVKSEGSKEEYQKFFNGKLAKYKVKSPSELSDADKKKFYNEIDKEWDGENEED